MATYDENEWRLVQARQKQHVRAYRSRAKHYQERRHLLEQLKKMVRNHEDEWLAALHQDLGKTSVEGYASELGMLLNEIDYALKHLQQWMRPASRRRLWLGGQEQTRLERCPYGAVLIIAPWNYPVQLSLIPLVGALAAGNSCFIKPSEHAAATSQLLRQSIAQYFAPEIVTVVEGDAVAAQKLLTLDWDFIFFTGSKAVGKLVYQQAARQTIPVVLELGGKNPCIVDETGLTTANVQQIVWGKFINAGQSCIAPDTIYVQEAVLPRFLTMAQEVMENFYGDNPQVSADYGRIISPQHFQRLVNYLPAGQIVAGGRYLAEARYIEPTILTKVDPQSAMANEEIFGPLMPVIPYADLPQLAAVLKAAPAPLVTYFFSNSKPAIDWLAPRVTSAAISINQVFRHAASPRIPFGGVGASGFGRYHGEASFDTFSYQKVCYRQTSLVNFSLQYPPYQSDSLKWLKRMRKWLF